MVSLAGAESLERVPQKWNRFCDENALNRFESSARLNDQAVPPDRIVLWGAYHPQEAPMPTPPLKPDEELDRDLDEALEETFPASDPISPMDRRDRDDDAGGEAGR
jgi:hypothetical protein